jgi:biopolymer transport protein ExbD
MRIRRLHKKPAALEITAFLNLIVVLVPFLLSTAVFSRLAVLQLTLPAQSSSLENLKGDLQLEVVIRPDALEVGDRIGGLIQRIANLHAAAPGAGAGTAAAVMAGTAPAGTPAGNYDVKALSLLLEQIKARFPDKNDATVLAEPDTSYDVLVQVMDAVRVGHQVQGANVVRAELFPEISIGDAPIRARQGGS